MRLSNSHLLTVCLTTIALAMVVLSFIKTDSATHGEITPSLEFTDCVFAIEDVEHRSYRSMLDAWSNTRSIWPASRSCSTCGVPR